jgi:hypothetical protein
MPTDLLDLLGPPAWCSGCWPHDGEVAEVVLAELAGGVVKISQEPRERRRAGSQVGRAAGELRWNHAGAQRMHSGEEGVAPAVQLCSA